MCNYFPENGALLPGIMGHYFQEKWVITCQGMFLYVIWLDPGPASQPATQPLLPGKWVIREREFDLWVPVLSYNQKKQVPICFFITSWPVFPGLFFFSLASYNQSLGGARTWTPRPEEREPHLPSFDRILLCWGQASPRPAAWPLDLEAHLFSSADPD